MYPPSNHPLTHTHTHTATPSKTGGLFGSDDEDDDMFFTPSKPKAVDPKQSAPSSSAKKMTQAEKDALSAAAFGDGGGFSFGADDDLFGGAEGSAAVPVSCMGKGSSIPF